MFDLAIYKVLVQLTLNLNICIIQGKSNFDVPCLPNVFFNTWFRCRILSLKKFAFFCKKMSFLYLIKLLHLSSSKYDILIGNYFAVCSDDTRGCQITIKQMFKSVLYSTVYFFN